MASVFGTPAFNKKHSIETKRQRTAKRNASKRHWDLKLNPFLDQIRIGKTVNEAAAHVGIEWRTAYKWKERYPDFAVEFDRAMAVRGQDAKGYTPFNAEFRQKYFGMATPWHLQRLIDLINSLQADEWGLALFPPNFAKSTTCEDFVTWLLAVNPDARVLLISKTQMHAKKELGRVKERMTNHGSFGDFIDDFGPFKHPDRPWRDEYIRVSRQAADERDYSIQAVGVKGQVYGSRCDFILLDDIADTENQTAGEIAKQEEWLDLIIDSRLDPEIGKLMMVGTRIREDDIYGRLMEREFFAKTMTLPAIVREPGANGADDPGESLWPERWPIEKLLKKRSRISPRIWALSYQQDPLPTQGAIFPIDAIESCYDESRFISHVPSGTRVVVGVDPAVTGYTAGVVLAVDPKTQFRYLVDVWNEENLTGDGGDRVAGLTQFVVELCKKYQAEAVCIEANSAFRLFTDSLHLRQQLNDLGVRYIKRVSGGQGETEDFSVAQLSGLFTSNLISLPARAYSKAQIKPFVDQFVRWHPGDKKLVRDIVKATQMAEHAAKALAQPPIKRITTSDRKMPPYLQKQRFVRQVV